ncbi:unnamed protein product [Linum trigynum]|uniref:Uncharacterized protein n=1 Tax=Linum trigynum TaxID=586398 RepID=A0AAV2F978_9ROSI
MVGSDGNHADGGWNSGGSRGKEEGRRRAGVAATFGRAAVCESVGKCLGMVAMTGCCDFVDSSVHLKSMLSCIPSDKLSLAIASGCECGCLFLLWQGDDGEGIL